VCEYRTTYKNGNGGGLNGDGDKKGHHDDTETGQQESDQPDSDIPTNNDNKTPNINDAAVPLYVYAFLFKH
jgi:hypothetical protein